MVSLIAVGFSVWFFTIRPEITIFEECEKAGYPVMQSYPRQCRTSDGELFIEDISKDLKPNFIFFPTQKEPARIFMQALLSGTLEEINGCLRVNGDLIIWPYGFSLGIDKVSILDDTGHGVALIGDKVRFGGGGFSEDESEEGVDIADILGKLSAELPSDRCSGPYWLFGEIM